MKQITFSPNSILDQTFKFLFVLSFLLKQLNSIFMVVLLRLSSLINSIAYENMLL